MNSADSCNAGCASRVIQTAQESSQTARSVATSVAGVLTEMENIQTMVDGIKDNTDDIEGQVIQLRNDIIQLSTDIASLKQSVDDSMVPTVDDNIMKLVIAILSAFTICIVVCQLIIFYSGRIETKKEERKRIMVQQRANDLI
tara:strand:+ start:203 stop:631 length:429 start_codon:yes stop_codon:yes gene_type:complete